MNMPEHKEGRQPEQPIGLGEKSRRMLSSVLPFLNRTDKQTPLVPSAGEYPLTERLSFISKYVDEVSVDHVLSIFRTPGYNMLTPYFGLKIFDGQPTKQMEMISTISNAIAEGGYTAAGKQAADLLTSTEYADAQLAKVSAKDITRISLRGPTIVENKAQEILKKVINEDETPVIIAYGGLLGLKAAIDNGRQGGQILIIIPQSDNSAAVKQGYKLTKRDGEIDIDYLIQSDLETSAKLALIDDSTSSGTTFTNTKRLFPNAIIQERTLFND